MKVIFLDIDGVLVTPHSLMLSPDKHMRSFDKRCVDSLNNLLLYSGAELVLSSNWQNLMSLDTFNFHALKNGLTKKVIDKTIPDGCIGSFIDRNAEISSYIISRPQIAKYVVLDDLELNFGSNFVKTDAAFGLTDKDVSLALRWLL